MTHIISGCEKIAGTAYTARHDQVAKIIHQKIAKNNHLIEATVPYYKYHPKTILNSQKTKLYWNRTMYTDKTVNHNRPDIVLIKKEEKIGYIIDIAVPRTGNLQKKYEEKIEAYQRLSDEMKRMHHLKDIIHCPIIISATGAIPKQLFKSLDSLGLKKNSYLEMQKAALLGTSRLVREFMSKPEFPLV